MLAVLKEMMNFKLLADPLFFLIGISNAFAMIGFYTPFVYLPNMAIVTGVSVPDASFLVSVILESFLLQGVFLWKIITITATTNDLIFFLMSHLQVIGISNTLGRVLAGWVSDFSWVSNLPFEICPVIPFSNTTIHLDLPIAVSNEMTSSKPLISAINFSLFSS